VIKTGHEKTDSPELTHLANKSFIDVNKENVSVGRLDPKLKMR
jgi:hypothetical protein